MLAVKFYEDDFYKNTFYAKLGGIPPWEMNCLEV
jgi:Cyclin